MSKFEWHPTLLNGLNRLKGVVTFMGQGRPPTGINVFDPQWWTPEGIETTKDGRKILRCLAKIPVGGGEIIARAESTIWSGKTHHDMTLSIENSSLEKPPGHIRGNFMLQVDDLALPRYAGRQGLLMVGNGVYQLPVQDFSDGQARSYVFHTDYSDAERYNSYMACSPLVRGFDEYLDVPQPQVAPGIISGLRAEILRKQYEAYTVPLGVWDGDGFPKTPNQSGNQGRFGWCPEPGVSILLLREALDWLRSRCLRNYGLMPCNYNGLTYKRYDDPQSCYIFGNIHSTSKNTYGRHRAGFDPGNAMGWECMTSEHDVMTDLATLAWYGGDAWAVDRVHRHAINIMNYLHEAGISQGGYFGGGMIPIHRIYPRKLRGLLQAWRITGDDQFLMHMSKWLSRLVSEWKPQGYADGMTPHRPDGRIPGHGTEPVHVPWQMSLGVPSFSAMYVHAGLPQARELAVDWSRIILASFLDNTIIPGAPEQLRCYKLLLASDPTIGATPMGWDSGLIHWQYGAISTMVQLGLVEGSELQKAIDILACMDNMLGEPRTISELQWRIGRWQQ